MILPSGPPHRVFLFHRRSLRLGESGVRQRHISWPATRVDQRAPVVLTSSGKSPQVIIDGSFHCRNIHLFSSMGTGSRPRFLAQRLHLLVLREAWRRLTPNPSAPLRVVGGRSGASERVRYPQRQDGEDSPRLHPVRSGSGRDEHDRGPDLRSGERERVREGRCGIDQARAGDILMGNAGQAPRAVARARHPDRLTWSSRCRRPTSSASSTISN